MGLGSVLLFRQSDKLTLLRIICLYTFAHVCLVAVQALGTKTCATPTPIGCNLGGPGPAEYPKEWHIS